MSILSKKQYIFFLRGALPRHRAGGDSQEGRGSTCAPHTGHASWRSGVAGPGAVTRCSPRSSPGRGRCPPARSPGGQPDRALSPPSTLNVSQPVTGWFACTKSKPPTVYFLTQQARDLAGGAGLPEGWLRGDRAVEPRGLQRLRHSPPHTGALPASGDRAGACDSQQSQSHTSVQDKQKWTPRPPGQ